VVTEITAEKVTESVALTAPPTTAGMTTKVMRGSLWSMLGQIAPLLVTFASVPFVIRLLGTDGYGVFILVGLIPGYFGFADFGMGMGSTKFATEAYADGQSEREARIVRTAILIALIASFPISIGLSVFSGDITVIFNVPEHLQNEASLALKIASITFVINFLNSITNTPQLARLRMDLNTLVSAIPRIGGIIATPIVLYLGGGIVGAVSVLFVVSVLTLTGHFFFSSRLLPELFGVSVEWDAVRPMLKFGGALVLASISAVVLVNIEKIILVRTTSVETLAHYSVAYTFASMMTIFTVAMGQSLIPAFTQLATADKQPQLHAIYSRTLKINVFGILPGLLVLAIIAKPFFTFWAGDEFGRESPAPFYVLLTGLFFNLNAYVPWALLLAFGRTDIFAKSYWIQLLPYLALAYLLTHQFGAIGAASAWSLRVVFDAFVTLYFAKRVGRVGTGFFKIGGVIILGVLILTLPLVFIGFVGNSSIWLIPLLCGCLTAYTALVWAKAVDQDEKKWIIDKAGTLYKRILRFV
jgi:O-antigen/teichoic acid export membrane protein